MSKFENNKIIPRYFLFAFILAVLGLAVLGRAMYVMVPQRGYWEAVAARLQVENKVVQPVRGNILSCDGQLMASSIPEYKLYIDFKCHTPKTDTLWTQKSDSIYDGLHRIFPTRSAAEFRRLIEAARAKRARQCTIWPRRVSYATYQEVKALPVLRLAQYTGGFYTEEFNSRKRPFGSLAMRTVGDLYGGKDTARCGLELCYDSILRGRNGLVKRRKVLNKYISTPVEAPIDGADIVTTIDVGMQDLAERSLLDELRADDVRGDMGVAIVMEVKTGDIKAMVNMTRCSDGRYREIMNNAISYRCEPGSVFKTASILVALDDGVIDTSYVVHTGSGTMDMHGSKMKDHNWYRGGYQDINIARSLEVSSNIGVSFVIDKFYGDSPERFVDGIRRVGMAQDLRVPIVGYHPPIIRRPKKNSRGQWLNWSKTALPWMSIGYETQVAPINTVAFYNAIANGGCMVRPRFVKRVVRGGETVREFPVEVLRKQIAKPAAIKTLQTVLRHVVSQGLGKKAGSELFQVAGKTGTAQVSQGAGGYKSGTVGYWLSFCGYFPADAPRYTCLVCIRKYGLPASGGGMSGKVFHQISEGIMARNLKLDAGDARDAGAQMLPDVKSGNILAADYVLTQLKVRSAAPWTGTFDKGEPVWGKAEPHGQAIAVRRHKAPAGRVPDVGGMGARDAVYLLESRGLKTKITGVGIVRKQSLTPGSKIRKGQTCTIELSN